MKISDGWREFTEPHPTPLPYDPSNSPAVVAPTQIADSAMVQGGVRDLTGERLSQLSAGEAAAAAAMSGGMSADGDRRSFYEADIKPLGAAYGITMDLPPVPEQATTPTNDFLYSQGDQPGA